MNCHKGRVTRHLSGAVCSAPAPSPCVRNSPFPHRSWDLVKAVSIFHCAESKIGRHPFPYPSLLAVKEHVELLPFTFGGMKNDLGIWRKHRGHQQSSHKPSGSSKTQEFIGVGSNAQCGGANGSFRTKLIWWYDPALELTTAAPFVSF